MNSAQPLPLPVSAELSERLSHEIEVTPAFYDIDPMEVVWHGHYVKFMELARGALLARLGYGYAEMRDSGFAWPAISPAPHRWKNSSELI